MTPFLQAFRSELAKVAAVTAMRLLDSSNLRAMGYDPKAKALEVAFKTSGTYRYTGVPAAVPRKILRSKSKGAAFHRLVVQGGFPYEKLEDE